VAYRPIFRSTAICLIEPEAEVEGFLTVSSDKSASLDDLINKYVESATGFSSNLPEGLLPKSIRSENIRPEIISRADISISGLPAISCLIDYSKSKNKNIVEYAFFFAKSNKVYKLVFSISSKKLDSMKSSIDSIVSSLVIK
jgi:hypothetical protein